MHVSTVLATFLCALSCVDGVLGKEFTIVRRQDNTNTAPTQTSSNNAPPSSTITSAELPSSTAATTQTSDRTDEETSTVEEVQSTSSSTVLSTTQHETSTSSAAKATKVSDKKEVLPIQPTITPAIGIAGVIMMLSGLAFCLIGIKHQWLHVYLSAAYSTALGVTVLVVYVMSPPVSDAVQGAYFVAAVLTGLIFGALALVFKEITEGLGCLLGGFCLAMWFMVLTPGGLVQSDPGRAIMIGVFSAVGLSLTFSQYTRNYGLIFCTAFAGAMITVIGIDCFSRAGLKEFWLYVWNLNKDVFPIGTDTYPVTRGIRVEIAVTIIIFLFGVMSQMKIWKIVKERREKKEAAQLAQDESRDQLAGEVGQDVEALNERSRAQWEAVYGNGSKGGTHQDSGVGTSLGSTHKKSTSVTTREVGPIEMDDYPDQSGSRQKRKSGARVGIITRSIRSAHRESRSNLAGSADWSSRRTSHNSGSSGAVPSQYEVSMPQKPGGPSMVPLPFSPPVEEDGEGHSSESIQHQGMSLNPLALKRLDEQSPARLRKIEDDRASSIAATADDEPELDQRSMGRPSLDLPTYDVGQSNRLLPNYEQIRDRSRTPSGQRSPQQETDVEEDDEEMLVRPLTARHDSEPPVTLRSTSNEGQHKRISSAGSHRRSIGSRDLSVVNEQNVGTTAHVAQDLTGHLPESISKVAMAYRTNEWAKHIADADQPDDTEEGPDSPGIQVDHAFREEAARPVDTAALSEVPVLTTTEGPRKAGTKPSKNPYRKSREAPPSVSRKTSGTPVYAFQRSDSQQSQQSLLHPSGRRDTRNASALVEAPLLESPGEETNLAAPSSTRSFSTPMGSSSNLLDQRNDRLERRTTTTSFAALGSGSRLNVLATDDSASAQGYESISRGPSPGADMTLAERRAFMQQQQLNAQAPTPKKARRSSGPAPSAARMHSANNPNLIYDSHQPRRSNTVDTNKQQNMFNQWRSSLQQNSNPQMPLVDQDQARQAMIVQQQQAAMDRQRRQSKRMQRESRMDVAMRTGQLHSAHTDVLRKMQAKANESAK